MTGAPGRSAWQSYWSDRGGTQPRSCLPQAPEGLRLAQRQVWQDLARSLAKGAKVIDLGTGDGAVLRHMAAVRPDLKLLGIDASPEVPTPPKPVKLRGGVPMEQLPFRAAEFDAAVSQFGFEYSNMSRTAAEVTRVLKPSGVFMPMIHHSGGPVVTHNVERARALAWATAPGGWLDRARALAQARTRIAVPTPASFASSTAEAARLFPGQSVAVEFVQAVLQALATGNPHETLRALEHLRAKAGGEIARIESMSNAAMDPVAADRLRDELQALGYDCPIPEQVKDGPRAAPFAWLFSATKP